MKSLIKLAIPLAVLLAIFGCSKDDDNNPSGPNNNTFQIVATVNGVAADSALSGSVTFTVTNNSAVTGVFRIVEPAVSSHNLTGFYIDSVNVLTASGDGYNFGGILNDTTGFLEGTVTGAANGLVVGALDEGNDNSAVAYCGTFTGSDSGTWNFMIEGTAVYGSHTTGYGGTEIMTGTVSGNTITLYQEGIQVATGTLNGDNVSGTWNGTGGDSGTWSGSRCN